MSARALARTAPMLLVLLVGCDRRAVIAGDGVAPLQPDARPGADRAAGERAPANDLPAPPPICQKLSVVGQVALGQTSAASRAQQPALAFDGTAFGVIWYASPSPSATVDSLRFARVNLDGTAPSATGLTIAPARAGIEPVLRSQGGAHGALFTGVDANGSAAMGLARFDAQGKPIGTQVGMGNPTQASLAPRPDGHGVLYVNPYITELHFAFFPKADVVADKLVHTGEPYWSLWIDPRSDGWAAAWGKRFARLDTSGTLVAGPATVLAADALSTAHVAVPGAGYAIAYARSTDFMVGVQRLDVTGTPLGAPTTVAPANIGAAPFKQIGLVWTGTNYVVTYPGGGTSNRVLAQILGPDGVLVGGPLEVPGCLMTSGATGALAWGGGRLAVATVDGYSGIAATAICVTVLECR